MKEEKHMLAEIAGWADFATFEMPVEIAGYAGRGLRKMLKSPDFFKGYQKNLTKNVYIHIILNNNIVEWEIYWLNFNL